MSERNMEKSAPGESPKEFCTLMSISGHTHTHSHTCININTHTPGTSMGVSPELGGDPGSGGRIEVWGTPILESR